MTITSQDLSRLQARRTLATGIGDEQRLQIPARRFPLRYVLPFPPSVNNMYSTIRGRRVLSEDGRKYKAEVKWKYKPTPMAGEVDVEVRLFRPAKRGDTDNYLKALLDSLKGIAWADDKQVRDIHVTRREDPSNPRAEVDVIAAPGIEVPHAS